MANPSIQMKKQAQEILDQVRTAVVGKDRVLLWVLAAILAKGHILLEDIPGVGKTTMALAFSKTLGLKQNRVQFTPDVLPSDITGYSILDSNRGTMVYQPGSVLCNLFLADELNRATSRTQSALLEAMEEGQVTVDGISHPIPKPFIVMATQNPTGAAGTQLLPDSQMDRFMVRLRMGYPDRKSEIAMVMNRQKTDPLQALQPLLSVQQLTQMQETVAAAYISEELVEYVVALIHASRTHENIAQGASPRATLAVIALAKAIACLHGRDYVVPTDIREVLVVTLGHRLQLTADAQARGISVDQVLAQIVKAVPTPSVMRNA